MRVVKVGTRVARHPLVPKGVSGQGGTLGDERDAVVVLGASLVKTVPVDGHLETFHLVVDIHNYLVSLADLWAEFIYEALLIVWVKLVKITMANQKIIFA